MARNKKDRTNEVQTVFENLKHCDYSQLEEVIERAKKLLERKKAEQLAFLRAELEAVQNKISELENA